MVKMVGSKIEAKWKTFENPLEVLMNSERLFEYLEVCSGIRNFRIITTTDEITRMDEEKEKTVTVKNRIIISININNKEDYDRSLLQLTDVLHMEFEKKYDKYHLKMVCKELCNSVELYFHCVDYGKELEVYSEIAGCELIESSESYKFSTLSCGIGF